MSGEGWKTFKLGELGRVVTGKTPQTQDAKNFGEEYPFITPRDMAGQKKIGKTERYLSEQGKLTVKNCLLPPRAVCVSCIGSDMGKVVMTTQDSVTNQQLNSIICSASFDPNFVYYSIIKISDALRNAAHHSTAVPILNKTAFSDFEIDVPDLPTQTSIAAILSALDDKIELNRQTNATLEAIAQEIFKEWFVDFRYPGATGEMQDSELGPIPKGWQVVTLGEISDLSWGDTNTTKKSYTEEGFTAYSASGPDGFLPYHDFERTGIVVSAIGAYAGKAWLALGKWSCIKNTIRFWSTDEKICNEYLYIYTSQEGFWSLRGSAQPFISQTDARRLNVIYPDSGLAKKFGEISRPLYQRIRDGVEENTHLARTRDAILPKLMSGEIAV